MDTEFQKQNTQPLSLVMHLACSHLIMAMTIIMTDHFLTSESAVNDYTTSFDNSEEEEEEEDTSDYAFMTESFHERSNVTVGKEVMLGMQFSIDNNLTYKAMGELLKLLQVLCATPNKLPKSVYLLKNFFSDF